MIGNNELHLNMATMNMAVEEYLNRQLVGTKLKVTNVSERLTAGTVTFVVKSEAVAKKAEPYV